MLAVAPALPRAVEPRRHEPPSGGARHQDDGPLPSLQHIESDPHFVRNFVMLFGGIVATFLLFLSLPITQKLSETGLDRSLAINMDRSLPPPPPPPEIRQREEPKKEEAVKPELQQETPKLNLAQLEAALNPGFGGTGFADFSLNLGDLAAEDLSRIFELAELDRPPVPIYQQEPVYPYSLKNGGIEGYVVVRFVVTPSGSVTNVKVVSSTRYEFERPSIDAILKWRFESGVKHGTKVSSWMEQRVNYFLTERN